MTLDQAQRPRFFEGQYLGAEDLSAILEYGRYQSARHLLGGHSWGIAMGLELREVAQPGTGQIGVYIQPGYAWDGFGRPIAVLEPYLIPTDLFRSFTGGGLVDIWLRYVEAETSPPRAGFEACDVPDPFSRVRESFRVVVGLRPNHADRHEPIGVGSGSADAQDALRFFDAAAPLIYDESIPYQRFPEQWGGARWLLPLGLVRWAAGADATTPGQFVNLTAAEQAESRHLRRYAGVVAGELLASDGQVRARRRTQAPSVVFSDDLLSVEGSLRVDGDARLFGSSVSWLDRAGADQGAPLRAQRAEMNALGGKALQVVIGAAADKNHSFEVGPSLGEAPGTPGAFTPRLAVIDSGNVGVGTASPGEKLEVNGGALLLRAADGDSGDLIFQDANGAQKGRIWAKAQPGISLHLSSGDDNPDITINAAGNVGVGVTTPGAKLEVGGSVRGDQNGALRIATPTGWTDIGSKNGDWSHFYTDRDRYYFNQGLWVDSGLVGSYNEDLRLHTAGVTRITALQASGNVGIGTAAPGTRLHVSGDRIRLEGAGKQIDLRTDGAAVDLQSTTSSLYLRASGPAGSNNLLLNPIEPADGRVGVGLQNPRCKLHVATSITGPDTSPNSYVALIQNSSAGAGGDVLALQVSQASAGAGNNFITFFQNETAIGKIQGTGANSVTYSTTGADFAECLPRLDPGEEIRPGDIVGIVDGRVTRDTRSAQAISVVTDRPGMLGNLPSPEAEAAGRYEKVSFVGQVPVRVRGPVRAGDLIVPSGQGDGCGVAAAPDALGQEGARHVLGQAWESAPGEGERRVQVAVGLPGTLGFPAVVSRMAGALRAQDEQIHELRAALEALREQMQRRTL